MTRNTALRVTNRFRSIHDSKDRFTYIPRYKYVAQPKVITSNCWESQIANYVAIVIPLMFSWYTTCRKHYQHVQNIFLQYTTHTYYIRFIMQPRLLFSFVGNCEAICGGEVPFQAKNHFKTQTQERLKPKMVILSWEVGAQILHTCYTFVCFETEPISSAFFYVSRRSPSPPQIRFLTASARSRSHEAQFPHATHEAHVPHGDYCVIRQEPLPWRPNFLRKQAGGPRSSWFSGFRGPASPVPHLEAKISSSFID